jgi:hypothetical protein
MRRFAFLFVMGSLGLTLGGAVRADDDHDGDDRRGPSCSDATLKGSYGVQMEGTRPAGPPPGPGLPPPMETIIGVVIRTYDGAGGFTQLDNIHGSVTGFVPNRPGAGTYEVAADCTGVTRFDPGNGIVIEERLVVVDRGREILSIVASPQPVMVKTRARKIR